MEKHEEGSARKPWRSKKVGHVKLNVQRAFRDFTWSIPICSRSDICTDYSEFSYLPI